MEAIKLGKVDTMNRLLESGADVLAKDKVIGVNSGACLSAE